MKGAGWETGSNHPSFIWPLPIHPSLGGRHRGRRKGVWSKTTAVTHYMRFFLPREHIWSPKPRRAYRFRSGAYRYSFGQPSGAMLSLALSQFPFTAALVLLIGARCLESKSVFVDDSDTSRIIYSGWDIGNNCTSCYAEPDPTQPSNGTWHKCVWLCCIHDTYWQPASAE